MKKTVKTIEYIIERRRTLFAGKLASTVSGKCTSCGRPHEPSGTAEKAEPKLTPAEAVEEKLEKL